MEQTELIERARHGEPDAQDALVRMAQNRVYYHGKKMPKKEEDAQDAAQDVTFFIRVPEGYGGVLLGST